MRNNDDFDPDSLADDRRDIEWEQDNDPEYAAWLATEWEQELLAEQEYYASIANDPVKASFYAHK